jgi:hypothetical protein
MLIFITGENQYLAKRFIKQIKARYLAKNSVAELLELDNDSEIKSWSNLLAAPLFATSRLIIIQRVGLLEAQLQQSLAQTLQFLPETTVVVIWDGKKLEQELLAVAEGASKVLRADQPNERQLITLLKNITKELGAEPFEQKVYKELISEYGLDLWALEGAIFALVSGAQTPKVLRKRQSDQFALFRFVDQQRWSSAADAVVEEYRLGKPVEMLIGAIASALRRSKASLESRLQRVELLADLDLALKTGLIGEDEAVALLKRYLPDPASHRLKWEEVWEEIHA